MAGQVGQMGPPQQGAQQVVMPRQDQQGGTTQYQDALQQAMGGKGAAPAAQPNVTSFKPTGFQATTVQQPVVAAPLAANYSSGGGGRDSGDGVPTSMTGGDPNSLTNGLVSAIIGQQAPAPVSDLGDNGGSYGYSPNADMSVADQYASYGAGGGGVGYSYYGGGGGGSDSGYSGGRDSGEGYSGDGGGGDRSGGGGGRDPG